jgi:hypothetical protein
MQLLNLFLLALMLNLTGCISKGEITDSYDEFKGENSSSITLGKVTSLKSEEVINVVTAKFIIRKDNKGNHKYYLNFFVNGETGSKKCLNVSKGAEVMFLVNNVPYRTAAAKDGTTPRISKTLRLFFCNELVSIGPLPQELVSNLTSDKLVKFKIYGDSANLGGQITHEQLKLIARFILAH